MPGLCTICHHPQAKAIDLAIVRGQLSNVKIAEQFGIGSERTVRDHKAKHLASRVEAAFKRDTERRELDLRAELSACFRRVNMLLSACHVYLLDPENPEAYTLDSRADEITVIYSLVNEAGQTRRGKAKLQTLLDQINRKQKDRAKPTFDWIETKRADPRRLILEASTTLDRHLRMLGDLTGVFKAPQKNPREVNRSLYDEWVGMFLAVLQNLDPRIERSAVVQLLSEMPETTGEFMPMVQEELGSGSVM